MAWNRNQGKQFFRLGCLQDSERYRRATHVAKAPRCRRNMLAHAGPAAKKVSEFVVPSAGMTTRIILPLVDLLLHYHECMNVSCEPSGTYVALSASWTLTPVNLGGALTRRHFLRQISDTGASPLHVDRRFCPDSSRQARKCGRYAAGTPGFSAAAQSSDVPAWRNTGQWPA